MLHLEAFDPQLWPRVLDVWKDTVLNSYLKGNFEHSADEMFEYLATYLTGTSKAIWEAYKYQFPNEFLEMKLTGSNPYNFCNKVSQLITASDPNAGSLNLQKDVEYALEQITLKEWKYIKPFLQYYFYFSVISRNTFNKKICERLFKKLPGTLGREIEDIWEK